MDFVMFNEQTVIYEQTPLMGSKTSFRLLEVFDDNSGPEPKLESDIISCKLYTADLNDSPDFIALSYMWGDENRKRPIIVNGIRFEVRKNLWDFLSLVRDVKRERKSDEDVIAQEKVDRHRIHDMPLWVDAICICQFGILERNHQVSLMGEIYSRANMVVSWLGSGNDALHEGLLSHKGEISTENLNIQDISSVYSHPYWKRAWIFQEVNLAREWQIWCGSVVLDEQAFWHSRLTLSTILSARGIWLPMPLVLRKLQNSIMAEPAGACAHRRPSVDLDMLLVSIQDTHCADPRDRLFSILSMLSPDERSKLDIEPDYSKSREHILNEVSVRIWTNMPNRSVSKHKKQHTLVATALRLGRHHWSEATGIQIRNL